MEERLLAHHLEQRNAAKEILRRLSDVGEPGREIPCHRSDEERLMRRRRCMYIADDIREPAQILFI